MRSVLAIGAHPDDVELGCGGALVAHAAAGDSVALLVLTGGERGPLPGEPGSSRRQEQEEAARILGARLLWGGLIDCTLQPDAVTIGVIETALAETQADTVYVHAPDDSHQDHRAASAATLSAARRLPSVLHYQSPSTLSFTPSAFVDVTAYLSGKLAALKAHASQVAGSAMVEPDAVVAAARYWGAQARVGYAEAFAPTRVVIDLAPDPRRAASSPAAALRSTPPPVISPRIG